MNLQTALPLGKQRSENVTDGAGTGNSQGFSGRAFVLIGGAPEPRPPATAGYEIRRDPLSPRKPDSADAKPPPSVLAGNRNNSSAAYNNQGTNGNYWASSPTGSYGYNVLLSATRVFPANYNLRAVGLSVRCLKN